MTNVVYLDNNATTKVDPQALEAMLPYFSDYYGNPSSMHSFGGGVAAHIRTAREQLARLLGASADEIVFTSCGTESDSTAIRAAIESYPAKRHLVTSRVEHPAVKNLFEALAKKGYRTTFVPVDGQGRLDLAALYDSLSDDTAIVSLMWANNETGVIFPIEEISRKVKERGIVFHTDAVQAVGKIPFDLGNTGVDMLSLSGHKIHGPKGIGALYIRSGIELAPMIMGGPQEHSLRAGTENVPGIVGLGAAMNIVREHRAEERVRLTGLMQYLVNGLQALCPGAIVNGAEETSAPHILSVSFPGADAEMILIHLNGEGIAVSLGSACNSKSIEPSHVLTAMHLPQEQIESTLRISLGMPTTRDELDTLLDAVSRIMPRVIVQ